jgi:hypothetical protein
VLLGVAAGLIVSAAGSVASATEKVAPGFRDIALLGGVGRAPPQIVAIRFAPNGELFVAAQDGRVWEYTSIAARRAHLVANLGGGRGGSREVMDWDDRGLLSLAIDPEYPVRPYLYLLYTYNAPPGRTAPVWPYDSSSDSNTCPDPPGPADPNSPGAPTMTQGDGCIASGRLARIKINPATHRMVAGSEVVLIKDEWCDQEFAHTVGDVRFARDGSLYVSAGAGGIFGIPDYGEVGGSQGDPLTPRNPCGDPTYSSGPGPGRPGVTVEPAPQDSPNGISGAEGGMLRAQSFRRPANQPATLDGAIARVDPANGRPLPDNPNRAAADPNRRRIVAYGFREPFRFVFRPGTAADLWVGDVGESAVEEVDEDPNPLRGPSRNYGWPCYEGIGKGPTTWGISYYDDFELCAPTIGRSALAFPVYRYAHFVPLFHGDPCSTTNGSSISALAFADASSPYPPAYHGALFLGDFSRGCIWSLLPDHPGSRPDSRRPVPIIFDDYRDRVGAGSPTDLEIGPDHDLYYVDRVSYAIRELRYRSYPDALALPDRTLGAAPLTVHFHGEDGAGPQRGATLSWRFGDRRGGGGRAHRWGATHTYMSPGLYTATFTVTYPNGHRDSSSVRIAVGPFGAFTRTVR